MSQAVFLNGVKIKTLGRVNPWSGGTSLAQLRNIENVLRT